ncbi:MAG: glycosyl hydrolases family 15-domain-containing protein [Olpidium bornovanus]|uniref:Glycosyl hydrolases family 15-domain-containing protein n=1 Tax=Olpidium bornovanus TaxID=278681 RepID=A0A8H8A181_9FUNG|nr:MAG: glycosyl hydrolases family 15-domain-containing protein [Olpidium bornovanus]
MYCSTQRDERLDYYFRAVQAIILNRQNPTTGLIPASVAVTTHGKRLPGRVGQPAFVSLDANSFHLLCRELALFCRDNVYSIYAVFGLALAYRRLDDDQGRACKLSGRRSRMKLLFPCSRTLGNQANARPALLHDAPGAQGRAVQEYPAHPSVLARLNEILSLASTAKWNASPQRRGHLLTILRVSFFPTASLPDAGLAKYNTNTGDTVVGDTEWGHLQLDATSIYILSLAQMTAAGLQIIYTLDEVDFIQNLVFYLERSYRTPDYGIWERGNKINHGEPELNSSSIGMAVAALQAINGLNLFGSRGGPSSVIHVLPDEITRNYTILHSTLPRESKSKEVDAALLSVIGFPAFAVGDPKLMARTHDEIVTKLCGRYGCKRFLRDGHQTVVEDTSRLYYDAHELKIFENIECEWPLFFTYFILNGLFLGDDSMVEQYRKALAPLLVDSSTLGEELGARVQEALARGDFDASRVHPPRTPSTPGYLPEHVMLVPELYYVPSHLVNAERAEQHSQIRMPNDNIPLVWANSLYILGNLIYEDLLSVAEVDPLGRRLNAIKPHTDVVVQLVLLSENGVLQQKLAMYGLETQTIDQVAPVTISRPSALKEVYTTLGYNVKLGLSGRPRRPVGTLSTCKLYRVQGHIYAFTPHFMDKEEFYLTSDNDYLISVFEQELAFVAQHWWCNGRPIMICLLTNAMLGGAKIPQQKTVPQEQARANLSSKRNLVLPGSGNDKRNLLHFMMTLRTGMCNGVRVRLGRLAEMVSTSFIESLDFLVNKNEIDWFGILRGASRSGGRRKLGLSEMDGTSYRRSVRRSISGGSGTLSGLATPSFEFGYDKLGPMTPPSYGNGMHFPPFASPLPDAPFKLKDHEELGDSVLHGARSTTVQDSDPGAENKVESPQDVLDISIDGGTEALALTLGDPKDAVAAVNLVVSSVNLFDQIGMLRSTFFYGPCFPSKSAKTMRLQTFCTTSTPASVRNT